MPCKYFWFHPVCKVCGISTNMFPRVEPCAFSHKDFKVRRKRRRRRRRGGLPAPLFHSSMERNTNEKQRQRSPFLPCSLAYSDSHMKNVVGWPELLISPFLGSAKFPQASCTGSRHCTFMKDLTTSPYLENSWTKPATAHTTPSPLLSCVFLW